MLPPVVVDGADSWQVEEWLLPLLVHASTLMRMQMRMWMRMRRLLSWKHEWHLRAGGNG